jgi:diguanylate cyclase (GGDEF)-like protein
MVSHRKTMPVRKSRVARGEGVGLGLGVLTRQRLGQLGVQLRRVLGLWWGVGAAVAFAALVTRGFFQDLRGDGGDVVRLTAAAALASLLLARVVGRLRVGDELDSEEGGRWMETLRDLELGLLVVVSSHVLLQFAGGLSSPLYPMLYAMVTFLVAYNRLWVGAGLVATSLGLEALLLQQQGQLGAQLGRWLTHAGFSAFFGTVSLVLLRVEVSKLRREHASRLSAEIDGMRQEARDFRLISASKASSDGRTREQQEQALFHGSVESIRQAIYFTLELLKDTLSSQSAVLLWRSERGDTLQVKEMITEGVIADSELVNLEPFPALSGVLGGIVKNQTPIALVNPGSKGIPYYRGWMGVGAFLGVPVVEDGHLRGVLCLDRAAEQAFGTTERELLEEAAQQIVHTVRAERVFMAVERSKYEQERFFRASERLNSALGLHTVYETAFEAALEIVDFEVGAVTLYDEDTQRHRIAAVHGERLAEFANHSYPDNAGLVAMAIKNRHYLPAGGELRDRSQVIFAKQVPLPGVESLLVYPLIAGDRALGAFVLAGRRRGLFSAQRREMLGVIANQVAVSVQNGLMYQQMEDMATTDGLTGLANHRSFQDRFSEMLARAERAQKPVSLILTDIDHFKSVNDTYGHPVGDVVLKAVSKVLQDQARVVDVVARYGGEEFALVLEDTDADGALILAERIREQVCALTHQSDQGPFSCSMSLGIAAYPVDGGHKQLLVERADQSLYHAKEHGRNQSVCYRDLG